MNITQYNAPDSSEFLYWGKASLKNEYFIATADEFFYKFLGSNSCYPFNELVHKDDVSDFFDSLTRLNEGEQHLLLRIRNADNIYRYMYLKMYYNGKILSDFKSIDLELSDIISINSKYSKQLLNLKKYRKFLSLSRNLFYEYAFATGDIKIYTYFNEKSHMLIHDTLDSFIESFAGNNNISKEDRDSLYRFKHNIENGTDTFNVSLTGIPLSVYPGKLVGMIGGATYANDVKHLSVGLLLVDDNDSTHTSQAYYLSEAARDPATGLFNKKAIREYTINRLNQYPNSSTYIAIMDIDDFKTINDTYGHMFGDEVICKVSEIIRSVLSSRGVAGRFGGDEFFIVFENIESEIDLRRLLKTMAKHFLWLYAGSDKNFNVTVSFGIAKAPDYGTSYEPLFKKADRALYIAKAKGKNRFIIYDEAKHGEAESYDDILLLKNVVKNDKKVQIISDISCSLIKNGTAFIPHSLDMIRKYLDIDGIRIYSKHSDSVIYESGEYSNPLSSFDYNDVNEYLLLFDDNRMLASNNIHSFEFKCKAQYKFFAANNISGFVEIYNLLDEDIKYLVSFDVFNRKRKWSESDISYLTIISNIIIEILP